MACFATRLKKLRKEKKLRQEDLAELLGFSRTTIANYEQNIRFPHQDTLCLIADLFNVSLDYLLGRSNIRDSSSRLLKQSQKNIMLIIDPTTGKIMDFSPAAVTFYGYTKDELRKKTIYDLNIQSKKDCLKHMATALQEEQNHFYFQHRLANGEIRDIQVYSGPIHIGSNNFLYSIIHDVTEKKKVEAKLSERLDATLAVLDNVLSYKLPFLKDHGQKAGRLAEKIGQLLEISTESTDNLHQASLLMNIGYMELPFEILNKPGSLDSLEFELIKKHPQIGHDLMKQVYYQDLVPKIILQHHERVNGSGYPNGLSGDRIILEARILAVADVVTTLTSPRPFRQAYGLDRALQEIKRYRGIYFDPHVVDACCKLKVLRSTDLK